MTKDTVNTRRVYRLKEGHPKDGGLFYEEVPFMEIRKGDTFLLVEADGTPVPNRDGSVVCVAISDAYLSRDVKGISEPVFGIDGMQITEMPSPLKPLTEVLSVKEPI